MAFDGITLLVRMVHMPEIHRENEDVHAVFGFLLPMSQPRPLKNFTTFGVTAAVSGTRMKMKDL